MHRMGGSSPQLPSTFSTSTAHINEGILYLNLPLVKKQQLNYILNYLVSNYRDVTLEQIGNVISLISTMTQKYRINAQNTLAILNFVYRSLSIDSDKLNQYVLVLCPEIMSIVEKRFDINFSSFFKKNILLFILKFDFSCAIYRFGLNSSSQPQAIVCNWVAPRKLSLLFDMRVCVK